MVSSHLFLISIDLAEIIHLSTVTQENVDRKKNVDYLEFYITEIITTISNGNRTEWSPIRSVIIRVITKSDDRAAGVRFVYHEYDYRLNWTTRSPIIN